MKRPFVKLLPVYFSIFLIATTLIFHSCSSDDGDTTIGEEENEEEVDPTNPIDENENPDPTNDTVFEDNFVLSDDKKTVNYILPTADYDAFLEGNGDFAMVSNKIYEHLKDSFDFIFILSNETEQPEGLYFGISRKIKNDIQGIGTTMYDNTNIYGSDGKLKSIIHIPLPTYIRNGPFLHEIAHYWGNHGFIPTTIGGHWGYSSVGGQLGGFDELTDLGGGNYKANITGRTSFGTNANIANTLPYGNAELYIMGLIDASELESIKVAENPVFTGRGTFTADAINTITAAMLIADHGARIPSVENSQKDFKAITVVLSTTKLSNEEIASINTNLDNFSRNSAPDSSWGGTFNFWQATQEKATIDITIATEDIK